MSNGEILGIGGAGMSGDRGPQDYIPQDGEILGIGGAGMSGDRGPQDHVPQDRVPRVLRALRALREVWVPRGPHLSFEEEIRRDRAQIIAALQEAAGTSAILGGDPFRWLDPEHNEVHRVERPQSDD